jgi:hypothetical protein
MLERPVMNSEKVGKTGLFEGLVKDMHNFSTSALHDRFL